MNTHEDRTQNSGSTRSTAPSDVHCSYQSIPAAAEPPSPVSSTRDSITIANTSMPGCCSVVVHSPTDGGCPVFDDRSTSASKTLTGPPRPRSRGYAVLSGNNGE